ncbi:pyrroline-5-carboxylate reductase [Elongatibacter sediminis]|uniref:Pyrroline-5-carboxylate reductase n=1 Tax=Elongatibacter sediminis TaxID=3119006 RepID=A0AAW9R9N2_9GAMM
MLIAFIGGGNMATALVSGLQKSGRHGLVIRVADPSDDARRRLQSEYGVEVADRAADVVPGADVIVLAVKPQVMPLVLDEIADRVEPGQLILSIAAGTTIGDITGATGPGPAVIRAMPNTPALIGAGITGLYAGDGCKPHHREQAERILESAGPVVWVEEERLMDAVTAISGSGPAYFFLLAEALTRAGERLGLPPDIASALAEKTCSGAGAMLEAADEGADVLRERVTSPGGTTQAALEALASSNFEEIVYEAARAAEQRGRELAGGAGESPP